MTVRLKLNRVGAGDTCLACVSALLKKGGGEGRADEREEREEHVSECKWATDVTEMEATDEIR